MSTTRELDTSKKANGSTAAVRIYKPGHGFGAASPNYALWQGDVESFLDSLPREPTFDLVVTSPPYNIGKPYETRSTLEDYLLWQSKIIDKVVPRLKPTGSLCWQVGNYVDNGEILPLDFEFAPIFRAYNCRLRIELSGISATAYTTSDDSPVAMRLSFGTRNLTTIVSISMLCASPRSILATRHFKGPRAGELSGNPLGTNPEDVWFIPNCKSNHVEAIE